ncbi:MAG: homoserine O-acetyltransferase [Bacteroidetes bacterium]|nr:homoserine O-acetyltransferase [Bacteroidota bacterium]
MSKSQASHKAGLKCMNKHFFTYRQPVQLENGQTLTSVDVVYHTYGKLNADKSNVVWFCHALTANADVSDWWDSLVGEGKTYDPANHFIICANIIGSCYGSSGPLSINAQTQKTYYSSFPKITIRDMVQVHIILRKHLGIEKINTIIGGSMGGYQVIEWAITEPAIFENMVLVATSPQESAWGIAIHTAQRLAIETDPTWRDLDKNAGAIGLKAARAIGMLTYRNYGQFVKTQSDPDHKLDDYKASSYINYQGEKLVKRFNAYSYWILTKAMDSHNIARNRGSIENVLKNITIKTTIIGISSDMLCPVAEQKFMAQHIPNSRFIEINSPFGHDGFLIEGKLIGEAITKYE